MSVFSDGSLSNWRDSAAGKTHYPRLSENLSADICVVGGGLTGLTTAYLLQRAGKSVVVLDAQELARGETGRTTGHLTTVLDPKYCELEDSFGADTTALIAQSHIMASKLVGKIIEEEKIDCAYYPVTGYMLATTPEQQEMLQREVDAARRAGLPGWKKLSQIDIGSFQWTSGCIQVPAQHIFHPTKYMLKLAEIVASRGGVICTGNPVREVHGGDHPYVVTDDGHRVEAGSIVVTTHTPINDTLTLHTKQAAYRSYSIACRIPKDSYKPFLLWDMNDPYHYARTVSGDTYDMIVVGGEDHKTGQANDGVQRYQAVEDWLRALFPGVGPVMYRWSGQIIQSVDDVAFIGRNPGEKNIYVGTGFSGTGMTYGTIAATLITDLIMGKENLLESVYDPARKMFGNLGRYLSENSNALSYMVSDFVAPAEVDNEDQIGMGEGAILRRNLQKIAAYRDEQGRLHECSASCTHLGCIVQWNAVERSWDCPCDGSRYAPDGKVLHGPATKPLSPVDTPAPVGRVQDVEQPLQNMPPPDPALQA
ncbi:MAG: FAD-dependent oxidoreductase [bacterium]|nr:FAD-dependent oxidoreductase [bacterium]